MKELLSVHYLRISWIRYVILILTNKLEVSVKEPLKIYSLIWINLDMFGKIWVFSTEKVLIAFNYRKWK